MFERFGIIKKNSGFTVLELIIALTIFGIVSYVLFEFVFMHFFAINDETTKAQLNQEVRVALEKIVDEMRRAVPADSHETGIHLYSNDTAHPVTDINISANLIVIRFSNTNQICYRLTDDKSLIRYKLDDNCDLNGLPTGATQIYPIIASIGSRKIVDGFSVKLESGSNSDNYYRYSIQLKVAAGPDATTTEGTKITVSQDATVIKNKTPVP